MAELSQEQQQALARARARLRLKQGDGATAPAVSVGEDVGYGSVSGLFQGGLDVLGMIVNPAGALTQGDQFAGTIEDITGRPFYEAQTPFGKVAQTGMRVAPSAVAGGPGGTVKALLKSGLAGFGSGAASEVAGQATEGTAAEVPARIIAGIGPGLLRPSAIKTAVKGGKVVPPTSEELIKVGGQGFEDTRALGVSYRADAVKNLALKLQSDLHKAGIYPEAAPDTWRILSKLIKTPASPAPGGVTTIDIDALTTVRQQLRRATKKGKAPGSATPSEAEAAPIVRRALDDFVEQADPASVFSGPADEAAQLTKTARANYRAGKRSKHLNDLEASAELGAASTYSGQNLENKLRQRARDIVDPLKPWNREGFNKFELGLIEKVARGSTSANLLRWFGNSLGGSGGFPASIAVGAGFLSGAGPAALATPAAGSVMKALSRGSTKRAFREADEAVRSRSPLAAEKLQKGGPPTRPLLNRALPAVPIVADIMRDRNGIPILDRNGQPIPLR